MGQDIDEGAWDLQRQPHFLQASCGVDEGMCQRCWATMCGCWEKVCQPPAVLGDQGGARRLWKYLHNMVLAAGERLE